MQMPKLRILIADAQPITREGLRISLERDPRFHVIAEAEDGQGAAHGVLAFRPDLVVLDQQIKRLEAMDVASRILGAQPKLPVLVTFHEADRFAISAFLELGVKGFITKSAPTQEYLSAVHALAGGGAYFSVPLLEVLVGTPRLVKGPNRAFGLTEREVEVLTLIGAGFSNKDIARRLALSVRTVETHRLNIRKKTQSTRLSDLVSAARQIGAGAPERQESPPRLHIV
jgi:DNA-binding NarL/FixJ family response regulator